MESVVAEFADGGSAFGGYGAVLAGCEEFGEELGLVVVKWSSEEVEGEAHSSFEENGREGFEALSVEGDFDVAGEEREFAVELEFALFEGGGGGSVEELVFFVDDG